MTYFNKHNILNAADKDIETIDENCLLYQAEHIILRDNKRLSYMKELDNFKKYVELCKDENGMLGELPGNTQKISHDQMSAISCISYKYGLNYHKELWKGIKYFQYNNYKSWSFLHPRDWIFYGMLAENKLCKLLFPFVMVAMFITCHKKWKIRGTNKMKATDGKLLSWLRFNSYKMPITKKICDWLIKNNDIVLNWKNVFTIYFYDSNHPNVKIWND